MSINTTGHQLLEDVDLVRRRVARFALDVALAAALVALVRVVVVWALDAGRHALLAPYLTLAGALYACLWGATRVDRGWGIDVIRGLEAAVILASGGALALMSLGLPSAAGPAFVLLLTLTFGLILRAVLVPSSVRRTLVLAVLLFVPFLAVVIELAGEPLLPHVVFMSMWWAAGAFVAGVTSHVVYGLRSDVHRARRLGQYALEQKLGQGGMGVVYRARHGLLKRPTAVKVLRPEHTSRIDLARFEKEAQLTAQLTHPNTIKIYDYGRTQDGMFFYAMELLEGLSLAEMVVMDGPQPAGRVARILAQVAGALGEAHRAGVIHRDIKPSNILVVEQGGEVDFAKVVDFGLVKQLDAPASITAENALLGTPRYLAPEAIRTPNEVDARADIYAVGAVAYFLLTASDVFEQGNIVAVCTDHLYTQPQPPSQRLGKRVPADLEALVLACLAKDAGARPQTAEEVIRRLEPIIASEPWTRADALAWWEAHREAIRRRHRANWDPPDDEPEPAFIEAAQRIRDVLLRASGVR